MRVKVRKDEPEPRHELRDAQLKDASHNGRGGHLQCRIASTRIGDAPRADVCVGRYIGAVSTGEAPGPLPRLPRHQTSRHASLDTSQHTFTNSSMHLNPTNPHPNPNPNPNPSFTPPPPGSPRENDFPRASPAMNGHESEAQLNLDDIQLTALPAP